MRLKSKVHLKICLVIIEIRFMGQGLILVY